VTSIDRPGSVSTRLVREPAQIRVHVHRFFPGPAVEQILDARIAAGAHLVDRAGHEDAAVIEHGDNPVWEDWQLRLLANRYMVSREVILRRLLTFGKTTRTFYNQKRVEYEEIYQRERAEGGGPIPYYRLILRDNGPAFTTLVLSAYYNQAISLRDLSNFLGGIKLDHVGRIEQALAGSEGSVEV